MTLELATTIFVGVAIALLCNLHAGIMHLRERMARVEGMFEGCLKR